MNALRLGHTHLKVRELDRSIAFYSTLLGLHVTERVGDSYAFMTSGPEHHTLALQALGAHAVQPADRALGLYHIAFEAPDHNTFAEAWQRLRAEGIAFYPVDHHISWALYFPDPDGNGLEIYLDRRSSPQGGPLWNGRNLPLGAAEVLSRAA